MLRDGAAAPLYPTLMSCSGYGIAESGATPSGPPAVRGVGVALGPAFVAAGRESPPKNMRSSSTSATSGSSSAASVLLRSAGVLPSKSPMRITFARPALPRRAAGRGGRVARLRGAAEVGRHVEPQRDERAARRGVCARLVDAFELHAVDDDEAVAALQIGDEAADVRVVALDVEADVERREDGLPPLRTAGEVGGGPPLRRVAYLVLMDEGELRADEAV